MIVSVPHTGTRTLCEYLGENNFLHYGQNDTQIIEYEGHFDFPIRDPLETTLSWSRFQVRRDEFDEFRRWDLAINHLSGVDHTIHRVDKLPVLDGFTGPHWTREAFESKDLGSLLRLPEVMVFFEWFPKARHFFDTYFPEGFWWDQSLVTKGSLETTGPDLDMVRAG